jgi:O-glycosyl hydrolase
VELLEGRDLPSNLTLDGSHFYQRIDGFGVNLNSAAWGNGDVRPAIDALVQQMGAAVFRVVVEPVSGWEDSDPNTGDYSNDNPNWPYYEAVYSSPKFTNLWETIRYLNAQHATVLLNVQGDLPDWMSNPDHTVPTSHEDDWVTMMSTMLYYGVNEAGVRVDGFGPMNEPDNVDSPNQGPLVPPGQYVDMMDRLLARLRPLGLGDMPLVGPDCASTANATGGYLPAMFADHTLMANVYNIGAHSYDGTSGALDRTVAGSGYAGLDWWADEYGALYGDYNFDHGDRLTDAQEWDFAKNCFQDLLALLDQGASGVLAWDGVDSYYQLANSWSTWGQLSYDQATQTYAPRLRFYVNGMVERFVPPGSVGVPVIEEVSGLTISAFYDPATRHIAVVGENTSGGPLTLSGALAGGLSADSFAEYFTNAQPGVQMQRQPDVAVTGGAFTFQVPADTIFTLSSPFLSPPSGAGPRPAGGAGTVFTLGPSVAPAPLLPGPGPAPAARGGVASDSAGRGVPHSDVYHSSAPGLAHPGPAAGPTPDSLVPAAPAGGSGSAPFDRASGAVADTAPPASVAAARAEGALLSGTVKLAKRSGWRGWGADAPGVRATEV